VDAVNGVADFTGQGLNITKAGTGYILIATATGLAGAESQPFDITGGAVAQLAFATSPSNTPAGAPLTSDEHQLPPCTKSSTASLSVLST